MIVLQVIFWFCIGCILHSYAIYPFLLFLMTRNRKMNNFTYSEAADALPHVDILLAVCNEEKVIAEKIETTFASAYPADKIHFYIGSDASEDTTDAIVQKYAGQYPGITFTRFARKGKVEIVNRLFASSSSPVVVLTDANVFFDKACLYNMVRHFRNEQIGLVGGNIVSAEWKASGISFQEGYYQGRENRIKYREGLWGGVMMGAFGGCYAVRRSCFHTVPAHHIVDDFYITMQVMKAGYEAVLEKEAVAMEDVSNKISEEFRRKARISAGNFQNLKKFVSLLWPPLSRVAFAFFSHKVLRWLAPFFILVSYFTNLLLIRNSNLYLITFLLQNLLLLIPLLDWLLKNININFRIFRFITHFYGMNLALLVGFFRFLTGVKTSVWKPTERNQK